MKKYIIYSLIFILISFNSLKADSKKLSSRPNFLIIMVDDISPSEFGCYGNTDYPTPNIDALAEGGVFFNMAWATPMCSPTRALLTTGRYPSRTGVWHNDLRIPSEVLDDKIGSYNRWDFAKGHYTFARLLRENGYRTAIVGKQMSLGDHYPGSETIGFDEHFLHINEHAKLPKDQPYDGLFEGKWKFPGSMPVPSRFWHPAVTHNGKLVETDADDFAPDLYTDYLIDFIERYQDQPFLAYFPMNLVHDIAGGGLPTISRQGPGSNKGGSLEDLNIYVDMLVGRIVDQLDRLNLRDNTIVIFASDNGTSGASKMHATEEGPRVPFIVNGPGLIKKRGATDALMEFADVFPTLIDYSNTELPKGYEIDGVSMKPFLDGSVDAYRDSIVSYIATARMVRTQDWLLEAVDPVYGNAEGRLYFCDGSFSKKDYILISDFSDPKMLEARNTMLSILDRIPFPNKKNPVVEQEVRNYDSMPYQHFLMKGEYIKKIHP